MNNPIFLSYFLCSNSWGILVLTDASAKERTEENTVDVI